MIARDELRLGALLAGDGTFGSIYRGGWYTQGKLIAITLRQIAELRHEVREYFYVKCYNIYLSFLQNSSIGSNSYVD
ncbi:unnamed protein product [Anisakis simplex]|uniref:Protein kinase domain-containing protein n=1 Tax=Anisakis simplex TaxID=6269 RepID=A0A0M3JN42_ANISI|nr:unnamed protein product [Anisakis simplex]